MKFDIKTILIIILIGIIFYSTFKHPVQSGGGITKTDTIYIEKKTTEIKQGKDIYHSYPIYVPVPTKVDTDSIIKEYYSKVEFIDTLKLEDNLGNVIITDTISNNSILNRKIDTNIKEKVIIQQIKQPLKNQVYLGLNGGFNKKEITNISAGVLFKNKSDHIYQIGIGLQNNSGVISPYIGAGIYWKIKFKK